MPSSPKSFRPRQSIWTSRRSTVLMVTSLIGFSCFVCGLVAISRAGLGNGCFYGKPLSVIVAWDKSSAGGGTSKGGRVLGDGRKRHKAMGFVGVQTGFGSAGRRRALRQTWFPYDNQGLRRLEESTGLVFRFVIGRTSFKSKMKVLEKEISEYDDFLLLDIEEEYTSRPKKILAFFKAAYALYESDFYVKVDDDIYLRPDRLSFLLAKERSYSLTYIGCMKKGLVSDDQILEWSDPLSYLLGKEYFLHARSPIYALSADAVATLVALRNDSLRMFDNEDVTMGSWMLAMNVDHEHSEELCSKECTATSIAVLDIPKCSGLCNPEKKMLELHKLEICSNSSTLPYEPPDDDDDDDEDDEDD